MYVTARSFVFEFIYKYNHLNYNEKSKNGYFLFKNLISSKC